ncbi:Hypothetical_protein [Hexamita inflata]|uniref:Hypothetical_protein n=1 Tax=Hexamita inflata TaxID=28002 RepID=A0ABP1GVS8_9EUKA
MQTKLVANYKQNSKWHKQQKTASPLQISMSNQIQQLKTRHPSQKLKRIGVKHIGVHDKIVDHIEQVLIQYKAVKVSKENHNRLHDAIKPDIAINYRGERIYLDVGFSHSFVCIILVVWF